MPETIACEIPTEMIGLDVLKLPDDDMKWRRLYDTVVGYPTYKIITYDELNSIMGYNVQKRRSVIYTTNDHLIENENRMLINIKTVGYKIATASEQAGHAGGRAKRAKRQMSKGVDEGTHIDYKKLSLSEKGFLMDLVNRLKCSLHILDKRQEKAMRELKSAQEETKSMEKHMDAIIEKLISE